MGQLQQPDLLTHPRREPGHAGSRLWLVLVAATVVMAGCSEPERQQPELAQRWQSTASDYQRTVLDDGVVSRDEYERAVADTAACMQEAGFQTGPLRDVPDGVRMDFPVYSSEGQDRDPDEAWTRCWDTYLIAIESVYLAQHASAEGEAAIEQQLVECLGSNGVNDVPVGLTDFELFSLLRETDASTGAWFCREKWLIARGELGAEPPDE